MKHFHDYYKILIFLIIILLFFASLQTSANPTIYKPGTKLGFNIKWWGLSAFGTIEIIEKTKVNDREVLLVRSQSTEVGGVFGLVARLLRVYKESNTFDTYIDSETLLPLKHEIYKLEKDGSKKIAERVLFDRKLNRATSYEDKSTITSNVPTEIYDTFSLFLKIIHRLNTEDIFIGKQYDMDTYMYRRTEHIRAKIVSQKMVNGQKVYTLEISKLPDIFKYPASLRFEVTTWKDGLILPARGECNIDVPILSDITFKGDLIRIK